MIMPITVIMMQVSVTNLSIIKWVLMIDLSGLIRVPMAKSSCVVRTYCGEHTSGIYEITIVILLLWIVSYIGHSISIDMASKDRKMAYKLVTGKRWSPRAKILDFVKKTMGERKRHPDIYYDNLLSIAMDDGKLSTKQILYPLCWSWNIVQWAVIRAPSAEFWNRITRIWSIDMITICSNIPAPQKSCASTSDRPHYLVQDFAPRFPPAIDPLEILWDYGRCGS